MSTYINIQKGEEIPVTLSADEITGTDADENYKEIIYEVQTKVLKLFINQII